MQVLAAVREAVQHDIEPQPEGGLLTVAARPVDGGMRGARDGRRGRGAGRSGCSS